MRDNGTMRDNGVIRESNRESGFYITDGGVTNKKSPEF